MDSGMLRRAEIVGSILRISCGEYGDVRPRPQGQSPHDVRRLPGPIAATALGPGPAAFAGPGARPGGEEVLFGAAPSFLLPSPRVAPARPARGKLRGEEGPAPQAW